MPTSSYHNSGKLGLRPWAAIVQWQLLRQQWSFWSVNVGDHDHIEQGVDKCTVCTLCVKQCKTLKATSYWYFTEARTPPPPAVRKTMVLGPIRTKREGHATSNKDATCHLSLGMNSTIDSNVNQSTVATDVDLAHGAYFATWCEPALIAVNISRL